jgi:hypothetical protein
MNELVFDVIQEADGGLSQAQTDGDRGIRQAPAVPVGQPFQA